MPRPIAPFALQPADVLTLPGWLRMSTLEQSLAQRAWILLLLNEGVTPITAFFLAKTAVRHRAPISDLSVTHIWPLLAESSQFIVTGLRTAVIKSWRLGGTEVAQNLL